MDEGIADQHLALMTSLFICFEAIGFPTLQADILAEGAIALSVTLSGGAVYNTSLPAMPAVSCAISGVIRVHQLCCLSVTGG